MGLKKSEIFTWKRLIGLGYIVALPTIDFLLRKSNQFFSDTIAIPSHVWNIYLVITISLGFLLCSLRIAGIKFADIIIFASYAIIFFTSWNYFGLPPEQIFFLLLAVIFFSIYIETKNIWQTFALTTLTVIGWILSLFISATLIIKIIGLPLID